MLLLPVFAQPQPAAIDARQAYSQIYANAAWRLRPGQPLSGGGSTLEATNVTCSVLSRAVLFAASQRGYGQPVRILDAPCGDWNWMPSCLSRIAKGVGRGTSIVYRGVDVVDDLISTLNARRGDSLLSEQWSARVRLLPFLRADITNATEMAQFRGAVDVILHKHMIAHTPVRAGLVSTHVHFLRPHLRCTSETTYCICRLSATCPLCHVSSLTHKHLTSDATATYDSDSCRVVLPLSLSPPQNALITLALRALDGLGAMMLVHDNHPTTSRMSVRANASHTRVHRTALQYAPHSAALPHTVHRCFTCAAHSHAAGA